MKFPPVLLLNITMNNDKQTIIYLQSLVRQQEREAKAREMYLMYQITELKRKLAVFDTNIA